MRKARFICRAGLTGGLVLTSFAVGPVSAQPVDCVSTAAWQQWASANSETITTGYRHLNKAKRALKRGRSQRALSKSLYNAGRYFRSVSESPDGFASSFYNEAGRDFGRAAYAVDLYRINRASRMWSDGYGNLRNGANAIELCVDALEGR